MILCLYSITHTEENSNNDKANSGIKPNIDLWDKTNDAPNDVTVTKRMPPTPNSD